MSDKKASEEKNVQDVRVVTEPEMTPLQKARQEVNQKLADARQEEVQGSNKQRASSKGPRLSARTAASIVNIANNSDAAVSRELMDMLNFVGVDDEAMKEVNELLAKPSLLAGDQKPANLQVLSLPPGAQKPVEFNVAPGTKAAIDNRYYPTRYASNPHDEDFEAGDLIYVVHEDSTYTVLSVFQQTQQWQQVNHLPPMNLIRRVEGDPAELPKEVENSGDTVKPEENTPKPEEKQVNSTKKSSK
jgi:hypothetical protein